MDFFHNLCVYLSESISALIRDFLYVTERLVLHIKKPQCFGYQSSLLLLISLFISLLPVCKQFENCAISFSNGAVMVARIFLRRNASLVQ